MKPSPKTRVIGYVRVSSEQQADEGVSLDAQREKLAQYAALFDLNLVAVHVDAGLSAKTLERPGLEAALTDLREGRADGLLVAKLDRLTRSVRDLGTLLDRYFATGKYALLSVNEQIDTRSAAGRLMLNLLGAVSQWEREAIGERTRDALHHLRAKGVKLGRVGLGWERPEGEVDAEGRRVLRASEEEQATVERIVELRREGLSLRAIAAVLTNEGRLTKRGGKWEGETVRNVLGRVAPDLRAGVRIPRAIVAVEHRLG